MTTSLHVVIVSWNTRELLRKCLQTVYAEVLDCPLQVWVVDNASHDSSAEMVRENFPEARLIANADNPGFARANNQAIELTGEGYVLLLNPDTELKPGALRKVVTFMEKNPRVGAAGSMLLNPDGSLQVSCFPFPTVGRELWRLLHLDAFLPVGTYSMQSWDRQTPRRVDYVQGAYLMLRREVIDRVGMLDTDYFIYTEEADLCYRIQKAGWEVWWVPEAQTIHYGGQSTRQAAQEMFIRLYQSKLLFFRKHYGQLAAGAYKAVLFTTSLPRLLVIPLTWLEHGSRRQEHERIARHYRRLLAELPGL